MVNENINIFNSNVCIGPQIGTFCSIDNSGVTNKLRIKNSSGSIIAEYSLSYTVIDEIKSIEYVGPINTYITDNSTFFTLEYTDTTRCVIRRWKLNNSTMVLDLENVIIKKDIGSLHYSASCMAVEHYRTTLLDNIVYGQNYIEISNASLLNTGDRVFVGASTDADNPGKTEELVVNNVIGNKVYFSSYFRYEYNIGDSVCFYTNIYLFSDKDLLGGSSEGTLMKIKPMTGIVSSFRTAGYYLGVTGAKWSSLYNNIVIIGGKSNLLFIDPYDYYEVKKSILLDNIYADDIFTYDIYDVVFDDYVLYKLADKITLVDDDGTKTTEDWGNYYNLIPDSFLPYTNKTTLNVDSKLVNGKNIDLTIYVKVTDQFGVGLRDVIVVFQVLNGDTGGNFYPTNATITTDANGEGSILYTSGTTYDGITLIGARASGGLPSSGSEYVWGFLTLINNINTEAKNMNLYQKEQPFSCSVNTVRQISNTDSSSYLVFGKSFFTSPGGDWEYNSAYTDQVISILGMTGRVGLLDGPKESLSIDSPFNEDTGNISNKIKQVLDFESSNDIKQLNYFTNFTVNPDEGEDRPNLVLTQVQEDSTSFYLDQMNHSRHSLWVDDTYSDSLFDDVIINQFVFVEDAIPKFFSYKNDMDTDIWIRLRPFAYSLDPSTLVFKIKTISYEGETEYIDVTSQGVITVFDAGGGIQGIEFLYNPTDDFNANTMVYITIEIYDQAPVPNKIVIYYWFNIIGDYRAPYLYNLSPYRNQYNVPVDTDIYFEIKDDNVGVDIDSLEVYMDYLSILPTNIEKLSDNHYKVTCTLDEDITFDRKVTISVKVSDMSDNCNTLYDAYVFYTSESSEVVMDLFNPDICERGVSVKADVSFVVLDYGNGVDPDTIKLQVDNKSVDSKISKVPIIYRIS